MTDLQFVRRLVDSGTEVSTATWKRVLQAAIDLKARDQVRHDEACSFWRGAACDCPEAP